MSVHTQTQTQTQQAVTVNESGSEINTRIAESTAPLAPRATALSIDVAVGVCTALAIPQFRTISPHTTIGFHFACVRTCVQRNTKKKKNARCHRFGPPILPTRGSHQHDRHLCALSNTCLGVPVMLRRLMVRRR